MTSTVSYAQAEEALATRLSAGALAHSERVARTAGELAKSYGVDVGEARLAGLLHDWNRDLSSEALLAEARAMGLPVTDVDVAVPYLLHARTGASSAAFALPGLPEQVADAIALHTVGSSQMSELAKIVYLADMLEPGRKYPAAEVIRNGIGILPLDELFLEGYSASLRHLVEARKLIHPDTVAVWNSLVGSEQR
jgi:predicted HD superfamily hydrolase involved in NAD metabolism